MKELQVQYHQDLPRNFVDKFWIESGDDFEQFVQRFHQHDLFFSIEVASDNDNSHTVIDAINGELEKIHLAGGPKLPAPAEANAGGSTVERWWDILSCKVPKTKAKSPRGGSTEKKSYVQILASQTMLAPVDFNMKTITKTFGYNNIRRLDLDEPQKLIVIGT